MWRAEGGWRLLQFLRRNILKERSHHVIPVPPTPEALEAAYLAVFGSGQGIMVLDDLLLKTCLTRQDILAERVQGQQDVYRYIVHQMQAAYFRDVERARDGRRDEHGDHLTVNGRG